MDSFENYNTFNKLASVAVSYLDAAFSSYYVMYIIKCINYSWYWKYDIFYY